MSADADVRLEKRLRQVLQLLANAEVKSTTIPDDQGDFCGWDEFIAPGLVEQAGSLLSEWDEEDEDRKADASRPTAHADGGGRG